MTQRKIQVRDVKRLRDGHWSAAEPDRLTVEEPLEIRIGGESIAVIMRTPGDDEALVAGFMVTEGIVKRAGDIAAIERAKQNGAAAAENIIDVRLAEGVALDPSRFARNFYASSSCGICGKASIEAVTLLAKPVGGKWSVAPEIVLAMPDRMRASQSVFSETGSLHAAGLFDLKRKLIAVAEDVGRHNAVDKVIGKAAREGSLPLDTNILMVSGRISFEITQKALMAGIPLVAGVSGASSLAVDLAEDQGMTIIGFVRGGSMTVYHGEWRINARD